uniref:Methyltransferase domain-containing protein n=1 Tax=Ciona savignyi TaxID=51511 RepID=H2YPG7_CIOSA
MTNLTAEAKSLENVKNVVFCKTEEESQKHYDVWSEIYDNDLITLGFGGHTSIIYMFSKHVEDRINTKVLDLGGGTGLVSQFLRSQLQFKGEIDILNANMDMLYKASKKEVGYSTILRHWVGDSGDLPFRDATYDVIVCSGAFIPNHIPASAIKGILNVIKPGGLLLLNMRLETTGSYGEELLNNIKQLCSEKKLELLDDDQYIHFSKSPNKFNSGCFVYRRT